VAFELLLRRLRIDDPVGAVAVHGFCGVWGTLAVALVVPQEQLAMGRLAQLAVQATGVVACFAWSSAVALVAFALIRRTIGVRLSPEQELGGVDASGQPHLVDMLSPTENPLDEARLRALMQSDPA
jgi:ammonium transporter, Amt family